MPVPGVSVSKQRPYTGRRLPHIIVQRDRQVDLVATVAQVGGIPFGNQYPMDLPDIASQSSRPHMQPEAVDEGMNP